MFYGKRKEGKEQQPDNRQRKKELEGEPSR
jgi:hypothetical protein